MRLDPEELAGARRRALLIVAAGGDPHRELGLDDRAVTSLAADLDDARRRTQLGEGLTLLHRAADGLPLLRAVLAELIADVELAWRAWACALLAEELAEE